MSVKQPSAMDAESVKPSIKNLPEIQKEASVLHDAIQPGDASALIELDDQPNLE